MEASQRGSRRTRFGFGESAGLARLAAFGMLAAVLSLILSGSALASSFLDEVDRGRAAVLGGGSAELASAQGRTTVVDAAVASEDSPAFALGAGLAALSLDLGDGGARAPVATKGDRAAVERQVRVVLKAQASLGIGNRAVCLLTGRPDPRSIEALIRLVEPAWSCGPRHGHD